MTDGTEPDAGAAFSVCVLALCTTGSSLDLCLAALSQQEHREFEVIVAAAAPARALIASRPDLIGRLHVLAADDMDAAEARNAAAAMASTSVLVFVEENVALTPTWLTEAVTVFADTRVIAMAGAHRSLGAAVQWAPQLIDRRGAITSLAPPGDDAMAAVYDAGAESALVLLPAVFAIRRGALTRLGGFVTGLESVLLSGDISLRLARASLGIAHAPAALSVEIGYERSRDRERYCESVLSFLRSLPLYLSRHAPRGAAGAEFYAHCSRLIAQIQSHMLEGLLEPRDARALVAAIRAAKPPEQDFEDIALVPKPEIEAEREPPAVAQTYQRFSEFSERPRQIHKSVWNWRSKEWIAAHARWLDSGAEIQLVVVRAFTKRWQLRFVSPGYWRAERGILGATGQKQVNNWTELTQVMLAEPAR